MTHGFRVATAAGADLWVGMWRYYREWGKKTEVISVKGHAEKDGKLTGRREKENTRAGEDAETAYQHLDTPAYKRGYASQLESGYGPTIHWRVVVRKIGETVLRYLQNEQYLRY